jgi:hypothetical protein
MIRTGHSTPRRARACLGAALLAALLSVRPAAAEEPPSYVVLASTVPDLAVGALIDEDMMLDVPRGASLTLIDPLGAIKVIEGPFMGKLRTNVEDEAEPSFLHDLANIIAVTDTTDVALGMGRTTLAPEVSPWLVALEPGMPQDLCVSPRGQLVFYRSEPGPEDMTVRFAAADGGAQVRVHWSARDPLMRWPDNLPPEDGGQYVIDIGDADKQAATLHLAPASLATDAHAAVWLARHGCMEQAQAMVRRMALGG